MGGGNALDPGTKPELLPSENYVETQIRSVTAAYEETGGSRTEQAWDWIWYGNVGEWVASSPGEIFEERIKKGLATYSDYRPDEELHSVGEGTVALGQVTSMQEGQPQGGYFGPWQVSSSYGLTPGESPPALPPPPPHPEVARFLAQWSSLPQLKWEGGKMDIRLVWAEDAPRPERLGPVSKSFIKMREENAVIQSTSAETITIAPGASQSSSGGTDGTGKIVIEANQTAPGPTVKESLLPVTVLQHASSVTVGADPPAPATSLRLCRWLDAYNLDDSIYSTYPKYERDRFVVRLPVSVFPGKDKITIKVSTLRPPGTQDLEDAPTEIECTKNGGYFESKPMILVGDEPDDVWDQITPGDEELNDPTHVASPGGKVEVELPLAGSPKVQFPIAPYTDKIVVETYVVRSSITTIHSTLEDEMERQISRTQDVYKQVGIKVESRGPYECVIDETTMRWVLNNSGDGNNNLQMAGSLYHPLHEEITTVLDKVLEVSGSAKNVVRLVFFPCDSIDGSDGRLGNTVWKDPEHNGKYEGFVVIPFDKAQFWRVGAHEIGHVLSLDHAPSFRSRFYMIMAVSEDTTTYGDPDDDASTKRFRKEDVDILLGSPHPQRLQSN